MRATTYGSSGLPVVRVRSHAWGGCVHLEWPGNSDDRFNDRELERIADRAHDLGARPGAFITDGNSKVSFPLVAAAEAFAAFVAELIREHRPATQGSGGRWA